MIRTISVIGLVLLSLVVAVHSVIAQPAEERASVVFLQVQGVYCKTRSGSCRVYVANSSGKQVAYKTVDGDFATVVKRFPVGAGFFLTRIGSVWQGDMITLPRPKGRRPEVGPGKSGESPLPRPQPRERRPRGGNVSAM